MIACWSFGAPGPLKPAPRRNFIGEEGVEPGKTERSFVHPLFLQRQRTCVNQML